MAILDDTRADWNARNPLRPRTTVPWADRVGVSWHWIGPGKGPSAAGSHAACLKQVRDWQAQHQANGWKDLGYAALVCQHGRAIEGRGLQFSGSHSPGVNTSHIGIQFMVGEDTPGGITPVMVARAQKLRHDIGQLGRNIRRDWGHRDDPEASTACPGNAIEAWVKSGAPTKYAPAPQEDDMPTIDEILNARIPKAGEGQTGTDTLGGMLADAQLYSYRAQVRAAETNATVAALTETVGVLAKSAGVDPALIAATVDKAVRDRLSQISVVDKEPTA